MIMFLNFRAKCAHMHAFSHHIFPAHFAGFLFSYLMLLFLEFLCT